MLRKKREGLNQQNQKLKKGEVTTENAKIQRIIRDYYEQPIDNKTNNLEKMDRVLEKFNLPRLNQKGIEIVNNLILHLKQLEE